ncbi:MAG: head HK97 family portal protein [Rhizobiaceae bacterium MnEN-MB40S]|nr:MAG: head HK97 family portal protein [Rhizobiaceae bacterium MnEN-MB40S]
MSFLDSIKRVLRGTEVKSATLTDPYAMEVFGAVPTIAGPSINAATAINVPAVYSAIALISGAIGSLPAKVFDAPPNGGKRTAKDHPSYRLAHDEANDWTSAGELRSALTIDALLYGQGFAYVNRVEGRPIEILRLDPRSITVKFDEQTGEPFYVQHTKDNGERVYSFRDILHIQSPLGVSPITAGREAIAISAVLEKHASKFFGGGARPSAVFWSEEKTPDNENGARTITNIMSDYKKTFGSDGPPRPLILPGGYRYQATTMNSTDAQFLENRRFQIEEIARVFRVPTPMLFDLERATWSNSEEMFQQFLTLTLRPWLDAWEWAYERCLLTPEERAGGYYVEFVIDDLLTADATTRATVYGQYRAMGSMTANEVRGGLNLPAMEGADTLDNPNITPGTSEAAQ